MNFFLILGSLYVELLKPCCWFFFWRPTIYFAKKFWRHTDWLTLTDWPTDWQTNQVDYRSDLPSLKNLLLILWFYLKDQMQQQKWIISPWKILVSKYKTHNSTILKSMQLNILLLILCDQMLLTFIRKLKRKLKKLLT